MCGWVLALWLLGCGGGSGEVPTATVARGPFDVVLTIQGELEAVRSVTLSAPDLAGQTKITWLVDEGTHVETGDPVVRFDETDLQKMVAEARDDLEIALTKSEQGRAQLAVKLADLQNELTNTELSLERARMRVTDSETVPRVERESAKLDVQEATLGVERGKASLESARLEGEAELELLRLDAQRAKRQLDNAEQALAKAELTAPSPGLVVYSTTWKGGSRGVIAVGDTVWGGSSLVQLPDLAEMRVKAWVHEVDAAKVSLGQQVEVVIDAHPEPKHQGTVTKVADLAVRRDQAKAIKHLAVEISLAGTTPVMKPGMTVRAEVLVAHEDDVLTVPREALFFTGESPSVFEQGSFGWTSAPVVVGRTNDTHAVVAEGLAEGDVVALVDPGRAAEGEAPSPGSPTPAPAAVTLP